MLSFNIYVAGRSFPTPLLNYNLYTLLSTFIKVKLNFFVISKNFVSFFNKLFSILFSWSLSSTFSDHNCSTILQFLMNSKKYQYSLINLRLFYLIYIFSFMQICYCLQYLTIQIKLISKLIIPNDVLLFYQYIL